LLSPGGEIHILDTPFYESNQIGRAKKRSADYFISIGFPEAARHYFHHGWRALAKWNYEILYDPGKAKNKLMRFVQTDSPFPWIRLDKLPN